jgi:iron(III) transport system permease protein
MVSLLSDNQPCARLLQDSLLRWVDSARQEWLRTLIMIAAVLAVGWLVLYPLGILFKMGFTSAKGGFTLANYALVFTEPGVFDALVNSLIISTATTFFSLVVALPMAWAVSRTTMAGRGFFRVAVLVAFVIPNFITAIAWILLLGPNAGMINQFLRDVIGISLGLNIYSMSGLVMVLTFSFYPLIFFAATAALDNMEPSYEEAAQMSGASAIRGSLSIAIPLVLPAIMSSSVFVFLEAMGAFGAPAAIGNAAYFHTLTTKIYELFSYPPRFELAAAAATPIIAFTVFGLMMQRYAIGGRRYNVITGKASKSHAVDIGWRKWILFVYCALVIFATVGLPLYVLVRTSLLKRWGLPASWQNFTLDYYAALFDTSTILPTAMFNSFFISAGTATICVILAVLIVWLVERTTLPGRSLLTFISTVTFAFPGVALGVGFVLGYNTGPLAIYGTLLLFFVAFTAHRFPFAFLFLRNNVKQLSTELEEAARMSGASWTRTIVDISVPLLKSGILAAWMMVFAVTLRELSMAILLYVRGTETLPIAIFSFVDNGTFGIASSISVVLIALSILSVALLRLLSGKAQMEI